MSTHVIAHVDGHLMVADHHLKELHLEGRCIGVTGGESALAARTEQQTPHGCGGGWQKEATREPRQLRGTW